MQAGDDELLQKMLEAKQVREEAESKTRFLMAQKKAAEDRLLALSQERLQKAELQGQKAAVDALLTQFIMGGVAGKAAGLEIRPSSYGGRMLLYYGKTMIAVRIEENPAFPVFLVVSAVGQDASVATSVTDLTAQLRKYVKAFATVPLKAVEMAGLNAL